MDSHLNYLNNKRFNLLDGLRAISIFAVIWHHTAPQWGKVLSHVGAQGVTLFFAISGFLITTLLLRERDRNGHIDLRAFYLRRTLRIFPLYFGVLALYILAVTFFENDALVKQTFFDNLIYFATYTSNLFVHLDGRVVFYFAWSLAAEEQFYLVWPSIMYKTGTALKAFIPLTIVIVACIADQLLGTQYLTAVPLAIIGGALLAVALHTKYGFQFLTSFIGQTWSALTIIILLTLALINEGVPNYIIHLLFVLLVGSCVIRENHLIGQLLALKPLVYIGSISYGMYMFHMLCKNVVVKTLGVIKWSALGMEVFILTCLLSIVVASASYRYFESYFLMLKRRHER